MKNAFYTLGGDDGHQPIPCSLVEFSENYRGDKRIVARDEIAGGIVVSTVFLGLDHNFGWPGPAVLFETAILNLPGERTAIQGRTSTWDYALIMHKQAMEKASAIIAERKKKAER